MSNPISDLFFSMRRAVVPRVLILSSLPVQGGEKGEDDSSSGDGFGNNLFRAQ